MSRTVIALLFFVAMLSVATELAIAKDSRKLSVVHTASLNGTEIASGVYKVSWEAHSPEVTVSFTTAKGDRVIATAPGKIVEHAAPYRANAVVYDLKPDGSYTILEIRFAGMKQAIVFGKVEPEAQSLGPQTTPTAALSLPAAMPKGQAAKIRFLGRPSDRLNSFTVNTTVQDGVPRVFRPDFKLPILMPRN